MPRGFVYSHASLGTQVDLAASVWDLTASDSVLHSLRLDSVYGAVNSLQAPLASGARITLVRKKLTKKNYKKYQKKYQKNISLLVQVPAHDPMRLWSNLLGVGLKSGKPLAKINLFPSVPIVYSSLLKSSAELFKDKKTKEYVKSACGKRIR